MKSKGKIGISIHKKYIFYIIKELSFFEDNFFESLTIKIDTDQKKVYY